MNFFFCYLLGDVFEDNIQLVASAS